MQGPRTPHIPPCWGPEPPSHRRGSSHNWSGRRTAGRESEPQREGSRVPEARRLRSVRPGSSRNKTGCSGEPEPSCEGPGRCWSESGPWYRVCGLLRDPAQMAGSQSDCCRVLEGPERWERPVDCSRTGSCSAPLWWVLVGRCTDSQDKGSSPGPSRSPDAPESQNHSYENTDPTLPHAS